jgi:hypothetical protein
MQLRIARLIVSPPLDSDQSCDQSCDHATDHPSVYTSCGSIGRMRRRAVCCHNLLSTLTFLVILAVDITAANELRPIKGDPSCSCLESLDDTDEQKVGDLSVNATRWSTTYGLYCQTHDALTQNCLEQRIECGPTIYPRPLHCDQTWCRRSWCYVDPTNCSLLHRRSELSVHRYYSYATCGDMDSFSRERRLAALEHKIIRVAFTSNSGGWMGAYSKENKQYDGNMGNWYGPVVDFIREAAHQGEFFLNVMEPPLPELRNRSNAFFGGTSSFDFCIYTTALGYLDMCVGQYTVSAVRASSAEFFILDSLGVYLIARSTDGEGESYWHEFLESVVLVFQPFTTGTWAFMLFFFLPIFGCLMVYHEYGKRGSSITRHEKIIVTKEDGSRKVEVVPIPLYDTVSKSIYTVTLSIFQNTYAQSVITLGAMLNLLGLSFFTFTTSAAYTANLAALFSTRKRHTTISTLDEAVKAGYRFCASRNRMEVLVEASPRVESSMFVRDPIDLGGDGEPGFNCDNCESRTRVFHMLDPVRANTNIAYCHAAIATLDDLEPLHAHGEHCDKIIVGTPLTYIRTGIPIFQQRSPELKSLFLRLKNSGVMAEMLTKSRPTSACNLDAGGEGSSLSMKQLSGVWVCSFGFAFLGLLVTLLVPCWRRKFKSKGHRVYKRNQMGVVVECYDLGDEQKLLSRASSHEWEPDWASRSTPSSIDQGERNGSAEWESRHAPSRNEQEEIFPLKLTTLYSGISDI